jgi:hypothetical protein
MLACDFLTVGTVFLQRIYVLFFISLATRRIEYVAWSSNQTDAGSPSTHATSACRSVMSSRSVPYP